MKKLILLCILVLSMIGCISLPKPIPGQTYVDGTIQGKVLTTNSLVYERDSVTLEEYYKATLYAYHAGIGVSNNLLLDFRYYPKENTVFLFFERYTGFIMRKVLFSNGEITSTFEIKNLSNIDENYVPNCYASSSQLRSLYKILTSGKPVTIRVYTADGSYDLGLEKYFGESVIELLQVYFKQKTFDTSL